MAEIRENGTMDLTNECLRIVRVLEGNPTLENDFETIIRRLVFLEVEKTRTDPQLQTVAEFFKIASEIERKKGQ